MNKSTNPLFCLALLLLLITQAESWVKFCSIYCTIQNCYSPNSNDCIPTNCNSAFIWNSGSSRCQVSLINGWSLVDISTDVGGGIAPNYTTISTCGPQTAGQWGYSYYGDLTGSQIITFDDSVGVAVPHYQLRVMFWMILIDNWVNGDTITVTLNNNQSLTTTRASKLRSQLLCGNVNDYQDLIRFDQIFIHNDTNPYQIAITTNNSASKWGVKELVILARICHSSCTQCFGPLASQCYACQTLTQLYLSGTTCNQTCLTGYGMMNTGNVCVFCDLKCKVCFQWGNFCYQCKTSGAYSSYLYNYTCVTECPQGFYANTTDHLCYPCLTECTECQYMAARCLSCNTSMGFAWYNYGCFQPCPPHTYLDNSTTRCLDCSQYCSICQNSSSACLQCTLSGPNRAFLHQSTCVVSCPQNYYGQTWNGTLNTCQLCNNITCPPSPPPPPPPPPSPPSPQPQPQPQPSAPPVSASMDTKTIIIISVILGSTSLIIFIAVYMCCKSRGGINTQKNIIRVLDRNQFTLDDQAINQTSFDKVNQTKNNISQNKNIDIRSSNLSVEQLQKNNPSIIQQIQQNIKEHNIVKQFYNNDKLMTTKNNRNVRKISEKQRILSRDMIDTLNSFQQ